MLKTKIVRKDAYMRLSKAKGFCTEPQKGVLSLYFDSFSPPNAKRSKIKTFLKVSLVSLTFRLRAVFYFFEKMKVISLCWFTMKICPRSASGFGLGLALQLGLGAIFMGGNCPRILRQYVISAFIN